MRTRTAIRPVTHTNEFSCIRWCLHTARSRLGYFTVNAPCKLLTYFYAQCLTSDILWYWWQGRCWNEK